MSPLATNRPTLTRWPFAWTCTVTGLTYGDQQATPNAPQRIAITVAAATSVLSLLFRLHSPLLLRNNALYS